MRECVASRDAGYLRPIGLFTAVRLAVFFRRLLAAALLLTASMASYAVVPSLQGWYGEEVPGRPMRATYQEACADVLAYYQAHSSAPVEFVRYQFFEADPNAERTVRCAMRVVGTNQSPYSDVWHTNYCPQNSTLLNGNCQCKSDYQEDATQTSCIMTPLPELTPSIGSNSCLRPSAGAPLEAPSGVLAGHPIIPATGEKYRSEIDYSDRGPAPLVLLRTYRSKWNVDYAQPSVGLGVAWNHNHSARLRADPPVDPISVGITSAEGYLRTFVRMPGTSTWLPNNSADSLVRNPDGAWSYRRADDDLTFGFTSGGKLLNTVQRNGWTTNYTYNGNGLISTISNNFGRSLTLTYNGADQLSSVSTPDGRLIGYSYDAAGHLSQVTYPDGQIRGFFYENATFPQALTGLADETGARYASFAYNAQGRAISTELAGGVDRYQISYFSGGSASVTDPLGTTRSYSYGTVKNKLAVISGSQPSGVGESDARSRVQDANGLITSETDFKGAVTTTTWDTARRLPLSVTRASGTPEALTVTTQWHGTFALPVLVTEAGRTIAWTYDTQGNMLSRAVTDTSASPNTTRTWQWTYDARGLVATETSPSGAVTTYSHDSLGNVTAASNTLGHETRYVYDNANRVTSLTAPNDLVSSFTYDARDRLLTQTLGGQQSTTLTYNPTGTVASLALPSGMLLSYTYDAAHRLTGWSNNRGETGSFTLDAMGNRTGEQVRDASSAIAWSTVRTINSINRVSARTQGASKTDSFGYDANGELIRQTNGNNQSTQYGLDGLRRLKSITDAANATATLAYDALDAVTEAKDFKGVVTSYARDAQGNATSEASADTGTASTQYDALGLPSQVIDALGQATTISRDLLGRPTSLSFADGKVTTLRYDLAGSTYNADGSPNASKGYLSEIEDRSGITSYRRDIFGRVVRKSWTPPNGVTTSVQYTYNTAGQLVSVTNPRGNVQGFVYDATGQLVRLDWDGVPQLIGITWNPLGQPTGWTWAFGGGGGVDLSFTRTYDTAGRLTQVSAGGQTLLQYQYEPAGRIQSLTQWLAKPVNPADPNTAVTSSGVTWTAGYDPVGRITSFNASGATASFSYDANGNRLGSTQSAGGQTTSRTYAVGSGTNRLTGFTQSIAGTSTSVSYGYGANGDMTSDGLRRFTYDAEGRLGAVTTGATDASPTTRYAHNALGQRVFKTEPLYPPATGDESDPGFWQSLVAFFTQFWGPEANEAERQGWAYAYDEEGTLLSETGTGGAQSTGEAAYLWLPTASGPMPVMMVSGASRYAVVADHLNTPRRVVASSGELKWQWAYSAFGDAQPTVAERKFASVAPVAGDFEFNLRYPGQYFDKESGLFYNVHRSYKPDIGGYTQNDPIGLNGGWNRRTYVGSNPLKYTDPDGLLAQVIGPAIPVLGIGCALTDGCRKAVSSAIQSCGNAVGSLKDWLLSTSNPLEGEPGSCSTCNNSKGDKKQDRYYGADGWPATDVDYDHNHKGENGEKAGRPHAHDWGRPSDGSRPTHDDRGPARPVQPGEVR